MYNLNELHPIQINDLVRIGRTKDGGYVLSKSQLQKTDILLSFGIRTDWSFEESIVNTCNAKVYGYDYWTNPLKTLIFGFGHLSYSLLLFIKGKIEYSKHHLQNGIKILKNPFSFYQCFNPKKGRFFVKKYLCGKSRDEKKFIDVEHVFKKISYPISDHGIFVKMDIEGSEYEALPFFVPYFDLINGFVVEFHGLSSKSNEFQILINQMKNHFHIAHIHANNADGYIENTKLPQILEILFINKKSFTDEIKLSNRSYPIPDLDYPNENWKDDLLIEF